ncbi:MAG: hypothetical protein GY851_21095 [bacterium]|nr:hypothetical protein [bacterium]
MSKVTGGIYGKPSGKTGGVVWGRARSRAGKIATAREYVVPTDPQTAAQLSQRLKFQTAALLMSNLGAATWQSAWNRTLGELPGWQSMQSWWLTGLSLSGAVYAIPNAMPAKSLGPVLMPSDFAISQGGSAGEVDLDWSTAIVGDHAAATDELYAVMMAKDDPTDTGDQQISAWSVARSVGTMTFTGATPGEDYSVFAWFRHTEADGSITYSPLGQGYCTCP